MFEIIDERNKRIIIPLHLEQIYSALINKEHINSQLRLFSLNGLRNCHKINLRSVPQGY